MAITASPAPPSVDGLDVRELGPEHGGTHASIAAEAFGAPLEMIAPLTTPAMLSRPGMHLLVGDCDGASVTTALTDVIGAAAGIFNVTTRLDYRGRGFGSAVTAAAVRAAFADGAELAFLLSSEMGERVYAQLGFEQLEHWAGWVSSSGH